jgi:activator of HSP90 ATPase
MKTGTIKQKAKFKASPEEVYELLMDSKKHSAFTGAKAKIGKKEGDPYSAYDGYIVGKNIKLIPGKKIVQTWRAVDGKWPEDHESTITFDLKPSGKGTELTFTHADVPENQVAEFKKGWKDFYWSPMTEWLASK